VAVTHKQGLLVGTRSFPGNSYDGHVLAEQIEQSIILLEKLSVKLEQVVVDLGYRGKEVEEANSGVEIIHRGKNQNHKDALHAPCCAIGYNVRLVDAGGSASGP
jgi:transposase, IS5 family